MFSNERDYTPAVEALKPVPHNLPGKIIAVDGLPGVGKTPFSRCLAYRFNVSMIETDLFMIRDQGVMIYPDDCVNHIIASRIDMADVESRRPVVIEGSSVLRLLANLRRKPDFIIHVINPDAPESHGTLADDLERYDAEYAPGTKAGLHIRFAGN